MDAAEVRNSKLDLLRVDVAMITYNQEAYIAQAIESVLAQTTTFPVRMVIGEDCSTDNTRAIIQQYAQRYPERFLLLLPDTNQGVMKNLRQVLEACDAPYVAILEGDDYWVDSQKLQLQVEHMENNSECTLCVHDANFLINESIESSFGEKYNNVLRRENFVFSQENIILNGWFIPTASIVYKNSKFSIPDWIEGVYSGDYAIQLLATQRGNAYFINKIMSVYRLHDKGITRMKYTSVQMKKFIYENKKFKTILSNKFNIDCIDKLNASIKNTYFDLCELNRENYFKFLYYYLMAVTTSRGIFFNNLFRVFKKVVK